MIVPSLMSTSQQNRTNPLTLAIAAALGVGALAGCSGGTSAAPAATASAGYTASSSTAPVTRTARVPSSASARVRAAQAALRSAGSVHLDISSTASNGSVAYSDDATASGGRQVVTFDRTGHATILFIDGVGYLQADAQTLAGFFGMLQTQASQLAGRWISVRPGDKLGGTNYDLITSGITLSSVADELTLSGTPTPTGPTTVDGQQVVGVRGPLPASDQMPASAQDALYLTDNSLMRPVVSEISGGGVKSEVKYSQWGEAVHLTAPANAIPASSVSSPSSTT